MSCNTIQKFLNLWWDLLFVCDVLLPLLILEWAWTVTALGVICTGLG